MAGFVESFGVWVLSLSRAEQLVETGNLHEVKLVSRCKGGNHRWL